jgi:hypothetical protein
MSLNFCRLPPKGPCGSVRSFGNVLWTASRPEEDLSGSASQVEERAARGLAEARGGLGRASTSVDKILVSRPLSLSSTLGAGLSLLAYY